MTGGLVTLRPHATAHQAALPWRATAMRHVVVVDGDGRLVGVVSRDDLFGLQQVGVGEMSDEIAAAKDLPGAPGAPRRRSGASPIGLMAQGISAELLTHFTSTLNDLLTIRVIELTARRARAAAGADVLDRARLGGAARADLQHRSGQRPSSSRPTRRTPRQVRAALLPVRAGREREARRLRLPALQGRHHGGQPALVPHPRASGGAAFGRLDRRARARRPCSTPPSSSTCGPSTARAALAERLREWLLAAAADRPLFLRFMADNALKCQPPLGTIRDFVFDRSI